jgi:hypothetical protein
LGQIDLELDRFERARIRLEHSLDVKHSQAAEELLATCKTKFDLQPKSNSSEPQAESAFPAATSLESDEGNQDEGQE